MALRAAEAEDQRHPAIGLLLVAGPGLDLDLRPRRQRHVLDPLEADREEAVGGRRGVGEEAEDAVATHRGEVGAAVAVEVGGFEGGGAASTRHRDRPPAPAVVGIDEGEGRRHRRRPRRPAAPPAVDEQSIARRQVDPTVAVEVEGGKAGAAVRHRRKGRQRLGLELAPEPVAVENARPVGVGHRQVDPLGVGDGVEGGRGDRLAGDEREVRGAVAPAVEQAAAGVADQRRAVAEEQQVEVVVVVVVEPDRLAEAAGGEGHRHLLESSADVAVEGGAGGGDHGEIGPAVVVEIARRGVDHPGEPFEAARGDSGRAGCVEGDPLGRPGQQVRRLDGSGGGGGAALGGGGCIEAVRHEHRQPGCRRVDPARDLPGGPDRLDRWRRRLSRRLRLDLVVDLRVAAPLEVLRHRRPLLGLLDRLEGGQLALGVGGLPGGLVGVVELEVGAGEAGVETRRGLEVGEREIGLAGQLVEGAEVELGDRLVGHQGHHPLELDDGAVVLRVALEGDPEIEPGVWDLRRLLLHPLQLGDPLRRLARLEQGQPVVEPLARRVGRQRERLLELLDRLVLGGGVLVERLAEVAVLPEQLVAAGRRLGRSRADQPEREQRRQRRPPPHGRAAPRPSTSTETRSTGRAKLSTRPLGQRTTAESTRVAAPRPTWRRNDDWLA